MNVHLSPTGLATVVQRWSLASQTQARRNAMVALTGLAQRRVEREEVEAYLDARRRVLHHSSMPQQRRALPGG